MRVKLLYFGVLKDIAGESDTATEVPDGSTVGAVGGGLAERNNHYFAVPAAFPMIWGFTGLFAGVPTGYLSDFAATTVYRAK